MRDVWSNGGGRGLCGGPGKRVDGVFPGRPQTFRHQRRPVDDCSPGRRGMVQNGGTFHGKMDRCRKKQGWTTACSGMPECGGKDQGEDSPKQAGSCWFARPSLLTSRKWRELVSSERLVCRCLDVFLWCYVCFVLLRFRLYDFVEAAALRSIVLRYASPPIATRLFFFFFFLDVAFSEYFFVPFPLSLCMESTSYVLSCRMVFFYLVTTGWIFDIKLAYEKIQSIIQSSTKIFRDINICEPPDGHKEFRKINISALSGRQSDLTHLLSYNRSSSGIVGCHSIGS